MKKLTLLLALTLAPFTIAQDACTPEETDLDGDGWSAEAGDCNDEDAAVFPGAEEVCDGIDNNCDGVADEDGVCGFNGLNWTGGCYATQVGASGSVNLYKDDQGDGTYLATLEGDFTIYSPTYGYVRHELPPGFLPLSEEVNAYSCELQELEGYGDTSEVNVYGGEGVHVRIDTSAGYENGSLWFPEKFLNGTYSLTCSWETTAENPEDLWSSCSSISLL